MVKRRPARGLLVALGCVSVLAGFMACSGDSTRRMGRNKYQGNGGDGSAQAGAAGAAQTQQGGSASSAAGSPSEAGTGALAGESLGGAAGASGAAGESGGGAGGASQGGAGGESSASDGGAGGESSAGEGGEGGQARGGAGGDGGQVSFVDPVCGVNMVQVGAYSLWCGKVNMHLTEQGTWTHDLDCTSGCNINGVAYCQKYYPSATAIAAVPQVDTKDWKNAGCDESSPDGPGISGEAACCAPLP